MAATTAITPLSDIMRTLATPEFRSKIEAALPEHFKLKRMMRIIQTALSRNPRLGECTKSSLFGAIITASQLGLEINTPLGHAYLIPYRNKGVMECQLIIGYQGYIDLAWRSGQIQDIYAEVVREGDHFEYELGLERKLVHRPKAGNTGQLTYTYAVCNIKGGGRAFVVLDNDEVMKAKRASKSPDTVWNTDNEPAMRKKTAIRQLRKWIPQSPEMARAGALEDALDRGEPQIFDTGYRELDESQQTTVVESKVAAAKTKAEQVKKLVAEDSSAETEAEAESETKPVPDSPDGPDDPDLPPLLKGIAGNEARPPKKDPRRFMR